jgi:phosphoadenosine phosphosulfate reductase
MSTVSPKRRPTPAKPTPELAVRAGAEMASASAQEVLCWALDRFHPRLAITASMGDAVLVHMASAIRPGVPVIFLDTGYHFAETLGTRDAVSARYAVQVITVTPQRSVADQDAQFGARLHDRDPDACCAMRKVAPMQAALAGYEAWASGIRRDETPARADTPVVEWDAARGKVKVNPLAAWTEADVDAYITDNDVVVNPLLAEGYPSIGCAPCTRRVQAGSPPRAGRWADRPKTECGLHTTTTEAGASTR